MTRAVIVAIVDPKTDDVLVLKRAEQCEMQGWCLPGGTVEEGEYLTHAAVREVKEETGLIINPLQLRFAGLAEGSRGEFISLYWVEHLPQTVTLSNEHQDSAWVQIDQPREWAGKTEEIALTIIFSRHIHQARKGLLT